MYTVGIRKPDMSGFRMVDFGWFSNGVQFSNGSLAWTILNKNIILFIYKMVKAKSTIFFDRSKKDIKNVRFSNVSGFRMVGFRIPTVCQ